MDPWPSERFCSWRWEDSVQCSPCGHVFSGEALERQIKQHLRQALDYEVTTFLRTPVEVAEGAVQQPFGNAGVATNDTLQIAFLGSTPDEATAQQIVALRSEVDECHITRREVHRNYRHTISTATFSALKLGKILGMPATLCKATSV